MVDHISFSKLENWKKSITIGIDVSHLVHTNYIAGPQRITLSVFDALQKISKEYPLSVHPVNLSGKNPTSALKVISDHPGFGTVLESLEDIDVLLILDSNNSYAADFIFRHQFSGVVVSTLHDVLPLKYPQWYVFNNRPNYIKEFTFYLMRLQRISSVIISPSKQNVVDIFEIYGDKSWEKIEVIPYGTFKSNRIDRDRSFWESNRNLICVNTIEPKKGHNDLLDAFDILLRTDEEWRLTLVGKEGWNSKDIVNRITTHRQFEKRLIWLENLDDLETQKISSASAIAISASRAEGFGLTVEEALAHGLKFICRDIPVFRERPNKNLYYFSGGGKELAEVIHRVSGEHSHPNETVRTMQDFSIDLLKRLYSYQYEFRK